MNDETSRPAVRPVLATGLVVAGTAATAFGALVLPRDFSEPHPSASGMKTIVVLLVLVAGAALARGVWDRRGQGSLTPAVGQAGAWRAISVAGSAVAALLVWWSVAGAVEEASKGFLGLGNTSVAIGAVLALVGWALVLLGTFRVARAPGTRRTMVGVAATSVGTAAIVGAAALVVPDVRLDASTTSASKPATAPEGIGEVAWRTPMPSGIQGLAVTTHGAAVLLDDGVVGVDGESGKIRWSYRRAGAVVSRVEATADGRTVALQWRAGEYGRTQFVFLDAATGKVLHADTTDGSSIGSFAMPLSNTTYVGVTEQDRTDRVTGYDVLTGERQWRYRSKGCRAETALKSARFDRTIVLPMVCWGQQGASPSETRATLRLVAFRDGSEPVWTKEVEIGGYADVLLNTPRDGSRYSVIVVDGYGDDEQIRFGVDPDTGEDRPFVDESRSRPNTRDLLVDADPKTRSIRVTDAEGGAVGTVSDSRCAGNISTVVTKDAAACVTYDVQTFLETGDATVIYEGYDGSRTEKRADVGGPFEGYDGFERGLFARAPGAWLLWTSDELEKGGRSYLVGLS